MNRQQPAIRCCEGFCFDKFASRLVATMSAKIAFACLLLCTLNFLSCQSWGNFWDAKEENSASQFQTAWYTFLGGAGTDSATSIAQTSDGGYIVTGSANANISSLSGQAPLNAYATGIDYFVIKLTAAGVVS